MNCLWHDVTDPPLTSGSMVRDAHHAAPESPAHAQLAVLWSAALDSTDPPRTTALINGLAREIHSAAEPDRIIAAGARLANADHCAGETLGRSVAVLHTHFSDGSPNRTKLSVPQILSAFTSGYEDTLRAQLRTARSLGRAADFTTHHVAEQPTRGDNESRGPRHTTDRDELTGLPNRSEFFDAVATTLATTEAIGLCCLDLDLFETIDDTGGFSTGDELLVQAAGRIRECVPNPDHLVARVSGDEFAILVPRCADAAAMAAMARSVLDALARTFQIGGRSVRITASAGVAIATGESRSGGELIRSAELAMRWAKAAGNNTFRVFDTAREHSEHTRAQLLAALPRALAEDQFFLDYQPIVALADTSIVAIEALVRWRHPEYGVLAPAQFIGLAEDNGHIADLGAAVLASACRDIRGWHRQGRAPTVNVNVSAAEVADPNWLERVCATITETGIEPNWLQLELTERTAMHTAGPTVEALQSLAALGIRIAIDDFGTGYSGLAYLGRIPLHAVKLAGQFVQRIRTPDTTQQSDLLVLQAIIDLTHALNSTATAECVETRHQAEQLRSMGCDFAQGWHFHRPVSPSTITSLLATTS
ncbi:putative bifunctional diguanylate cyclase/phosphodiesterase [Nocardia brasiliensis]|uniref:putative bifunctional diguanylate cyclase/phosphodiesterase n=1 Tax=Nocardia brasiliensis TaxID=37326 RepID=UPI003D8AC08A